MTTTQAKTMWKGAEMGETKRLTAYKSELDSESRKVLRFTVDEWQALEARLNSHQRLVEALKYPRFGDTAKLFEMCVDMLEKRDAKLRELTGENWSSLYMGHFRNAIEGMRAALNEAGEQ